MRYYYAIVKDNICTGYIDTFNEIKSEDYIITSNENDIIGKKWNGLIWEDVPFDEIVIEESKISEIDILINDIIDNYTLELIKGGII